MMKNQENSADDIFHKHVSWLDEWFKYDKQDILHFTTHDQQVIFDELSTHWKEPGILARLNVLQERFGTKVIEVIEMVVAENIRREWAEIARKKNSHTIDDLIRLLWEPLREQGFEFSMEKQDNGVQMRCTRCPHVDLGKELDETKWLYHLVCQGDPYIVEGFNPNMGFRRTKTLMEGHECCDHFYFMKDAR
jgi:predicted ArsR family transcriptional regulator